MIVRVVAATGRGLARPVNEDAVLAVGWLSQSADPQRVTITAGLDGPLTVAVADGLGGHAGGASASRLALAEIAATAWADGETVRAGLLAVDRTVHAAAARDERLRGMGTTVVGVIVGKQDVLCFNVGDSRAYLVVGGYPELLSTDDVLVAPGGESSGRLTQALGGGPAFRLDPHVVEVPGSAGNCRVLLCSDGVSGPVDIAELRRICREDDPEVLVDRLVAAGYAAGAPDNLSVALVDVLRDA